MKEKMRKFTLLRKKQIIEKKKNDIDDTNKKRNKSLDSFSVHLERLSNLKKLQYGNNYQRKKLEAKRKER